MSTLSVVTHLPTNESQRDHPHFGSRRRLSIDSADDVEFVIADAAVLRPLFDALPERLRHVSSHDFAA